MSLHEYVPRKVMTKPRLVRLLGLWRCSVTLGEGDVVVMGRTPLDAYLAAVKYAPLFWVGIGAEKISGEKK